MTAPDGLASMTQARTSRQRRTMPPPRHPAAINPTTPQSADSSSPQTSPTAESARPSTTTLSAQVVASTAPEPDKARPATIYLDKAPREYLDEIRISSMRAKVDVSMSAVVRLALDRLADSMSAEQVVDYLKSRPTDPTRTGRKRR